MSTDPVDLPKVPRPAPAFPAPVNDTEIVEVAPASALPSISISPSTEPGTHVVSLAPHTKIENYGPPPSAIAMLIRISPYLLAIAIFGLWGAIGKAEPSAAAGFITAFVLACLNARGGGPTIGASLAKNAGELGRRLFAKKEPPK